jgi:hypothetical protein
LNTSTPLDPGPPRNLCGERNSASIEASPPSGSRGGFMSIVGVRRAGRVVEAGPGVVAVQQPRDLAHRRAHAGDVRGGRERADAQPAPVLGRLQQRLEVREVHAAVGREVDLDHGGEPLPPRHLVRVVLVGTDEHHRLVGLLEGAERLEALVPQELLELLAEHPARRGRQRHAQDLLQLVDRARGAGAAGDDAALRAGVHRRLDHRLGLVQQAAHAAAGDVVLGVGVGVAALQGLQVALDEHQAAPRGGVVAIDHQPPAERRVERRVDADDLAAQEVEAPVVHAPIVRDCLICVFRRSGSPGEQSGHREPFRRHAMTHKQVLFRSAAREKILRGATQLADAVRITLGPRSKSVLIQKKWGAPIVCNDGVTIAKEFDLEDAEQNLGAQMLRQAAERPATSSATAPAPPRSSPTPSSPTACAT